MARKRIRLVGYLALALVLLAPAAARASTTEQQLNDAVSTYHDTLDAVSFFGKTGSEALSKFAADFPALSAATAAAQSSFSAAASSATDTTFKNFATQFTQATQDMSTGLLAMNAAVTSQDIAAFSAARGQFDLALHSYDDTLRSFAAYLKAHPEVGHPMLKVYLALLILSALLALGTLVFWLRAETPLGDFRAGVLKDLRQGMFLTSLAPLAGSAVTYFWYRHAITHGGSYFVLWSPVVIGFIAFVTRAKNYRLATARLAPPVRPASYQAQDHGVREGM